MIGLVLVTHGHLADEFRSALEHVVGPQKALETIPIGPEDDMDNRRQDIMDAVTRTDDGNGVQDPLLMRRALEYALDLGVVLAQRAEPVVEDTVPTGI